jgi:hypothetical protein
MPDTARAEEKESSMRGRALFGIILISAILWLLLIRGCQRISSYEHNPTKSEADTFIKQSEKIKADRDTLRNSQDSLIGKSKSLTVRFPERLRAAKMMPKRSEIIDTTKGIETNDSTTIFLNAKYDTVRKEMVYRDLILDSVLEVNNSLIYTIYTERNMTNLKDSLDHLAIVKLTESNESLFVENKKLNKKSRRWKVAFGTGVAVGFAISIVK